MGISSSVEKDAQSSTTTTTTKKQIFILSGQSNMAGRGGVKNKHWDKVVPDDCKPDPSTIHRLNANLIWETAQEPLHADIDTRKTCGVGPGMSFANAVKDYIVGVIDLVPCAVGGTAIKEWAKGEKLYEDMVRRAKVAVSSGGEIKCLLWYQGESDTDNEHVANSYKLNMENFVHNVRADLGLPDLPIIQMCNNQDTDTKDYQYNLNKGNTRSTQDHTHSEQFPFHQMMGYTLKLHFPPSKQSIPIATSSSVSTANKVGIISREHTPSFGTNLASW